MASTPPATILPILGAMASVFWPARSMVVTTASVAAAATTISVSVAASNETAQPLLYPLVRYRAAFLDAARKAYSRKTNNNSYKQRFYLHERSSCTRM